MTTPRLIHRWGDPWCKAVLHRDGWWTVPSGDNVGQDRRSGQARRRAARSCLVEDRFDAAESVARPGQRAEDSPSTAQGQAGSQLPVKTGSPDASAPQPYGRLNACWQRCRRVHRPFGIDGHRQRGRLQRGEAAAGATLRLTPPSSPRCRVAGRERSAASGPSLYRRTGSWSLRSAQRFDLRPRITVSVLRASSTSF
jgi:hypothetical protein